MIADSRDLVTIVQTVDSMSVAQWLGAFVREEAIVAMTAVLTPDQYHKPGQGLAANILPRLPHFAIVASQCGRRFRLRGRKR